MESLPGYIAVVFILTTLLTLFLFYIAARHSTPTHIRRANVTLIFLLTWLIIQAILALNNLYNTNTRVFPPAFILNVVPPLTLIIILFSTKNGRRFIDSLSLDPLTWISVARIPVEVTLYGLCLHKAVPELMTFAGRNFDILSGLTAPFVAYAWSRGKLSPGMLLAWNFIALGLLLNVVINAVLSAPFAFQQFALDTPNIAVLYFPYNWLPAFIVPVVLFCHLASIRILLNGFRKSTPQV